MFGAQGKTIEGAIYLVGAVLVCVLNDKKK